MAKIMKVDPKDFAKSNIVQVDVKAKDTWAAIDALEIWAREHGFARANENFLRIIMRRDGSRFFRGACYRITPEETTAMELKVKAISRNARKIGRAMKNAG